jgi:replication factor C subunit 3/5
MTSVLNQVAKKERFTLPPSASDAIIEAADGNLRKALLVMEAMRMQNPDLNGDVDVAKPDWELYCAKIAESIMQEQSPQRLLDIRGKIYELLSHCIPPAVVLKVSSRPGGYDQLACCPCTIADPRPSPTDSSPASTTRSNPSSCTGPRTT